MFNGQVFALSLALSVILGCYASPSFRFTNSGLSSNVDKGSADSHKALGSNSGGGLRTGPRLATNCPMTYDKKDRSAQRKLNRAMRKAKAAGFNATVSFPAITIPVHFHIIATNMTYEGGWNSKEDVEAQMRVLNEDFRDASVSFEVTQVDRIVNSTWYWEVGLGDPISDEMKLKLKTGGPETLNVFTTSLLPLSNMTSGYASFPWLYSDIGSPVLGGPHRDGVTMDHKVFYGGAFEGVNDGRYLTHEVGHWVGLYHTFEGGCDGPGDFVDDTPAQAEKSDVFDFECVPHDSCPHLPGVDLKSNFMDYSNPVCQKSFTPGQILRMRNSLQMFRGY